MGFGLDAAANSSAAAVSITAMLWSVVLLFLAMLRVTMIFLELLIALMCDSLYGAWWCVESVGEDEVTLAEFRACGEWRQCACGRANAAWPGGDNMQTEDEGAIWRARHQSCDRWCAVPSLLATTSADASYA